MKYGTMSLHEPTSTLRTYVLGLIVNHFTIRKPKKKRTGVRFLIERSFYTNLSTLSKSVNHWLAIFACLIASHNAAWNM